MEQYKCYAVNYDNFNAQFRQKDPLQILYDSLMNMAHFGQIGKFVHILRKSHWFAADEFAIMENAVNDREAIVNKNN